MSIFWSLWIIGLTSTNLALLLWVLLANRKVAVRDDQDPDNNTTGHVYDGIEEYDNPLPRWWFNLFIGTFIFAGIYLMLYPGMGAFPGLLGWTSEGELRQHQAQAEERYSDRFGVYANTPIEELAQDPQAMRMGLRLFANNCAACHGSDGGGAYGFPNLTDKEWLWGGSPEQIKKTIAGGRTGVMPAWGSALGARGMADLAAHVSRFRGRDRDADAGHRGARCFDQYRAGRRGPQGRGSPMSGTRHRPSDHWRCGGEP